MNINIFMFLSLLDQLLRPHGSQSNILMMIRLLTKHLRFYMVLRGLLVICLIRHISMLPHLVNIHYF